MKTLNAEKYVVNILNDLIERCKDGENGFQTASEAVKSQDLKTLFQTISVHRAQLVPELQEEIERLGGKAERTGSVLGSLHRGWINIKSAIATKNDDAIVVECERGEDAAVAAYEQALKEDLPPRSRQIIESQYVQIKKAHDYIRTMEKENEE
jgi:uncharacterized protein (TIGR02284 family)